MVGLGDALVAGRVTPDTYAVRDGDPTGFVRQVRGRGHVRRLVHQVSGDFYAGGDRLRHANGLPDSIELIFFKLDQRERFDG